MIYVNFPELCRDVAKYGLEQAAHIWRWDETHMDLDTLAHIILTAQEVLDEDKARGAEN